MIYNLNNRVISARLIVTKQTIFKLQGTLFVIIT